MTLPPVDLFSFTLGFVLGLIAAFVFYRIKKLQPQLNAARENRKKKIQISDIDECERLYRKYMLRKCQNSHLASALFPLNDIYIDLKLIGRPYYSNPDYYLENEPMVFQYFPISFGDSEGYADLPVPLLTLEQALGGGRNLVIMNEIGSGKTTLLAQFASRILEGKLESQNYSSSIPVFINIADLNYQNSDASTFIDDLVDVLIHHFAKLDADKLKKVFWDALNQSEMILLLDGFDELPFEKFQEAVKFTGSIISKYPQIKIIIASGPDYADGLFKLGFAPLSIQFPDSTQKTELIRLWVNAWNHLMTAKGSSVQSYLINTLWLLQDMHSQSIIDLTQAVWTNLALDHIPEHQSYTYDFIQRSIDEVVSFDTLVIAAEKIALSEHRMVPYNEMTNLLKKDPVTSMFLKKEARNGIQGDGSRNEQNTQIEFTNCEEIIDYLIDINFLTRRKQDNLTIANPTILAYLLAHSKTYSTRNDWRFLLHSPFDSIVLQYSQHQSNFLPEWIADNDPFLFRNLILAGRQMKKCKHDQVYYSSLARRLLTVILDESIPFSIRLRLFPLFNIVPQGYSQLLDRLMNHSSRNIRQLVALNLGRQMNLNTVKLLKILRDDQDLIVRMAACLSLFKIFNEESIDLLADVLLNGKDNLCIFVAELLAFKPGQGHAILKELLETGNIISKKAAISGLRLINEQWADDLLQKVSTSDEQWFVRDAAAHALESKWNLKHYVPSKRQDPSETSWLIKFASQEGSSVPAGIYPYDLLYQIIDSGTVEERLVSMAYLYDKPDERTLPKLKELMSSDNPLREEATLLFVQLNQLK